MVREGGVEMVRAWMESLLGIITRRVHGIGRALSTVDGRGPVHAAGYDGH